MTRGLSGSHVDVVHCDEGGRSLAFHRWRDGGPGDDVVVLASFTADPGEITVKLPRPGRWTVRLASAVGAFEHVDAPEDGVVSVDVPGACALVLSQDRPNDQ